MAKKAGKWEENWMMFPSIWFAAFFDFKQGGSSGEMKRRKAGVSQKEIDDYMESIFKGMR